MSSGGKLDKSLDEILSTQRRGVADRRRRSSGRPAAPAPVGGVRKNARPPRGPAAKPAPAKASGALTGSKIMVSNLPKDVSETQIKEYFQQAVGQVKKVDLSYGPGGVSRGIASVNFSHSDGASKAFKELNGLLIDNRPVKVEVVVASADLIPPPRTLGQRVTQSKAQPKSAAADKSTGNAAKGAAAGKGAAAAKKPRRGRSARPAKKTAEELDSEMADYFEAATANGTAATGTATAAAAAAPAAAANGDAPMEDEIM